MSKTQNKNLKTLVEEAKKKYPELRFYLNKKEKITSGIKNSSGKIYIRGPTHTNQFGYEVKVKKITGQKTVCGITMNTTETLFQGDTTKHIGVREAFLEFLETEN